MMMNDEELALTYFVHTFSEYWWMFIIRSIVQLWFGVFFIVYPAEAFNIIAIVFGVFLMMDGMISLIKMFIVCNNNSVTTDPSSRKYLMFLFFVSFALSISIGSYVVRYVLDVVSLKLMIIFEYLLSFLFSHILTYHLPLFP